MRNLYTLLLCILSFAFNAFSQTTLILQPDSTTGYDAHVDSYYPNNIGADKNTECDAWAWTSGGAPTTVRSLFKYDLSSIPSGAIILSARFTLYYNLTAVWASGKHSQLSGSNAAWLQRIVTSWDQTIVNWNNQPSTTTMNQASLPASVSGTQNYIVDVKPLVQDMVNNPSTSFGFMLRLQNESYYRSLLFASSNHANSALHPKLEITYTTKCTQLILQPDSITGYDAHVDSYYPNNTGADKNTECDAWAWTSGGSPTTVRSLFKFDLTSIPASSTIQSAYMTLYYDPNAIYASGKHSQLSGTNEAWLQRIVTTWDQTVVNWNNQPSTTTVNQAALPASTTGTENYTVDVTSLVQDMVDNPSTSFGFMLKLQNESYYRSLLFASSNHPDSSLHPKLEICYESGVVVPPACNFQASDTVFCANDCITYSDLSANATSWQWTFPGGSPATSTDQNPFVCYLVDGVYYSKLVISNNAGKDSATFNNYITVYPVPPTPVITQKGLKLYCKTDPSYIYYQWYDDATLMPGATDTSVVISHDGNYNVKVTNGNGCSMAVGINVSVGVSNYENDDLIYLYPNPASNALTIRSSSFHNEAVTVSIVNTLGELVYDSNHKWNSDLTINVKYFADGVYFLHLKTERGSVVKKFMKQ